MYPTGLIPNPSDISLHDAVSAPETVQSSSAGGAEARQTPSYGRFSVARSETLPVYSVHSLFPVMSQAMDASTSRDFGSGISSVGDVSRNMPLLHQAAMAPGLDPYSSYRRLYQEAARHYMESGFGAYDWTAASKNALGVSSDSGQPASSERLKKEADANELCSQQTGLQQKGRKTRTNFPEWKVHELNKAFAQHNRYISGTDRSRLASSLQMTDEQVKVWFQNKRTNSKKQLTQGSGSNFVQNMEASRAVPRAFLASQQTSPFFLQGVGGQKTYTLLSDRDVVFSTTAQSPIVALREMLAKFNSVPESRSAHSAAGSSQSRCPERELPIAATHTVTGGLTGGYDESDSSSSSSRESSQEDSLRNDGQ